MENAEQEDDKADGGVEVGERGPQKRPRPVVFPEDEGNDEDGESDLDEVDALDDVLDEGSFKPPDPKPPPPLDAISKELTHRCYVSLKRGARGGAMVTFLCHSGTGES
jgi:hypothetical protein